jgi:hypothetical protein
MRALGYLYLRADMYEYVPVWVRVQARAAVLRDQVVASGTCSVAKNITLLPGENIFLYPHLFGSCHMMVSALSPCL